MAGTTLGRTLTADARQLVDRLWSYCNVLRYDGVGTLEYTEQLTYLLFLKMAHERATRPLRPERVVPEEFSWQRLLDTDGIQLEVEYTRILLGLARQPRTPGTIFRKSQNRIQAPAKLKRLIHDLIDAEQWSQAGVDIKGDADESLLSRGAEDVKSGAGQYFTPRSIIQARVDCVQPTVRDTCTDPACGTVGMLLAAHAYASRGAESMTMVGADGREAREDREIERQDFVVTTPNKQLNFLQHTATILDINGRAAVVLPDNVLFEGGAGEVLRRRLLRDFDLHTMPRLPTGTGGPVRRGPGRHLAGSPALPRAALDPRRRRDHCLHVARAQAPPPRADP